MEGLTGNIMFNDDGKRYNYTLHIVQMTIESTITKVRINIFKLFSINFFFLCEHLNITIDIEIFNFKI